jgi:hypothetical protein
MRLRVLLLAVFALLLLASSGALAQGAPPPSDLEIMQARAESAEGQARYLGIIIRRMQAEETATAKWWADYVAALWPHKDEH